MNVTIVSCLLVVIYSTCIHVPSLSSLFSKSFEYLLQSKDILIIIIYGFRVFNYYIIPKYLRGYKFICTSYPGIKPENTNLINDREMNPDSTVQNASSTS